VLVTLASDVAIGASLEQLNGHWKPPGFYSRKINSTETRYCTYDREQLAIYAAIKFFEHTLEGRYFVIKTNHKPLIYIFMQKLGKANSRPLRQLAFITQFSTQVVHLSGSENSVADTFPRLCQINMPTTLEA
jgi:cleavage and polyadenylation specificity factor subunit 1